MKISKWITVEQEVDVEVTATDVAQCLRHGPDDSETLETVLTAINDVACFMRGIPDSLIDGMTAQQKQVIGKFLSEQAARFSPKNNLTPSH